MIFAAALISWMLTALPGGQSVLFEGKSIAASALPETVAKPVREAALSMETWAEKYRLWIHVAAGDPMVLAIPSNFQGAGSLLAKLRDTRKDFEKRIDSKPIEAAVEMIYVDKKEPYEAYVDLLVSRQGYLSGWAAGAKETAGFTLLLPFAAAYFRDPKDPKEKKAEFNLTNQLVHQFSHLLVNARFGRQPYWVSESIAWSLEQARENQIYAFCHRSGFVAKSEHGGWPKLGKTFFAGNAKAFDRIFSMDRDAEIPRALGAGSMALMEHLASKSHDDLLKLLVAFKADFDARSTEPGYKISVEKQKEIFTSIFGAGAFAKITAAIK